MLQFTFFFSLWITGPRTSSSCDGIPFLPVDAANRVQKPKTKSSIMYNETNILPVLNKNSIEDKRL